MVKRPKSKEVILVIVVGLLIVSRIFSIDNLVLVAIVIGLLGALSSFLSDKIAWLWFKVSDALGFIMSRLILTLIFFLILTPVALVSRLLRKKDLMRKKIDSNISSYFEIRNHEYKPRDLMDPW
jgi:hypothetical protein